MANVVRRVYRYMSASANRKFDEKADPRVQIDQAIEEARSQHDALVGQAALVVGNQRQLEMRMARQIDEVASLTDSARTALTLGDNAQAAGDQTTAARYEQTARAFAGQLVTSEASLEDLRILHQQAVESAAVARQAVEDNTIRLRHQLAERARLLTQIEHAAMREQMTKAMENVSELAPAGDTPTLAQVREKVEQRYAVALGRHELASQGVEAQMLEVRRATLDARANNRLAELRGGLGALGPGGSAAPAAGAITGAGSGAAARGPGSGGGRDAVALDKAPDAAADSGTARPENQRGATSPNGRDDATGQGRPERRED
jgi:phage shock protein A